MGALGIWAHHQNAIYLRIIEPTFQASPLPRTIEEGARVFEERLVGNVRPELSLEQRVQVGDAIAWIEPAGHVAAVVVATERKHVLPCRFQDAIDVTQHVVRRRIGMQDR